MSLTFEFQNYEFVTQLGENPSLIDLSLSEYGMHK